MYLDAWGGQPTNPWQLDLEQQQQPATAHALFVPTAGAAGLDLSAAFLSPAWQAAAYQAQQQDGSQQSEDGELFSRGSGRLHAAMVPSPPATHCLALRRRIHLPQVSARAAYAGLRRCTPSLWMQYASWAELCR